MTECSFIILQAKIYIIFSLIYSAPLLGKWGYKTLRWILLTNYYVQYILLCSSCGLTISARIKPFLCKVALRLHKAAMLGNVISEIVLYYCRISFPTKHYASWQKPVSNSLYLLQYLLLI